MTFHKYPKIKTIGTEETKKLFENPDDWVYIQEKIDGANFRFMPMEDGRIIFGSRTQSIGDTNQDIGGNWKTCVDFITTALKEHDMSKYAGHIFYGECCIRHSVDYDWDVIPPFLAYDIMVNDVFADVNYSKGIFTKIGLPFVPQIWDGAVHQLPEINEAYIPQSKYGNVQAEGIVIKNYDSQTFAKFVTQKFKEVNKNTFGQGKKQATNDNERLIAVYCTNPRIDKHVFNLVNDGNALDMPLMRWLPNLVWADIVDEHGKDILFENWTIDIREVRRGISKRCGAVLQQIITNQMFVGDLNVRKM